MRKILFAFVGDVLRLHRKSKQTNRNLLKRPSGYKGRLVTKAIWLPRPCGYNSHLARKAVWLHKMLGPGSARPLGRLVTKAAWLQRLSEYRRCLVTTAVWLSRSSSYPGRLVGKAVSVRRPSGYKRPLGCTGRLAIKAVSRKPSYRYLSQAHHQIHCNQLMAQL